MTSRQVEHAGGRAVAVSGADEVAAAIEREHPDVVLTDMLLCCGSGLDVARIAKGQGIRTVAMSEIIRAGPPGCEFIPKSDLPEKLPRILSGDPSDPPPPLDPVLKPRAKGRWPARLLFIKQRTAALLPQDG